METLRLVISIAYKFLRIVIESLADTRGKDRRMDVSDKKIRGECGICGKDMGDPSVKGCSEGNLFYKTEGPLKPIPHFGSVPCDDCGCHPGHSHHASCPRETCPICGAPLLGCPCGVPQDDVITFAAGEAEEQKMALEPLGGQGSKKRDTARHAFLKELAVNIGGCYRTSPTKGFPEGRVVELVNVSSTGRTLLVILSPDPNSLGVFWVKSEVFKGWSPSEVSPVVEVEDGSA